MQPLFQHVTSLLLRPSPSSPPSPLMPALLPLIGLFSLTLFVFQAAANDGWPGLDCEPGCADIGNCDRETGTCMCPYGLTGPTCSSPLFPPCRMGPPPHTWISPATDYPRNCHCMKQIIQHHCPPPLGPQRGCDNRFTRTNVPCFVKKNAALEDQRSDIPVYSDPDYEWFPTYEMRRDSSFDLRVKSGAATMEYKMFQIRPHSECEKFNFCRGRGPCGKAGNEKEPRCFCHKGFSGKGCEEPSYNYSPKGICFNQCSGKGRCLGGFCHCLPGWWGQDCSRSRAYRDARDARGAAPRRYGLRVYVYELPFYVVSGTDLGLKHAFDEGLSYLAGIHFHGMLLRDWSVRTENPWEANAFFIPDRSIEHTSNLGSPAGHLSNVIDYIKMKYPFWNRTRGRDHFSFQTGDRGPCTLEPSGNENFRYGPIRVGHFGLSERDSALFKDFDREYACMHPLRDIIVPPAMDRWYFLKEREGRELGAPMPYSWNRGWSPGPPGKKPDLLFFAGSTRMGDPQYSGGARQKIFETFGESGGSGGAGDKDKKLRDPDIKFFDKDIARNYLRLLTNSTFCLNVYGHGFGQRLSHYMFFGCIPVTIQDHVIQPFEDLLRYLDFSLRLSNDDIPRLGDILRGVGGAEVEAMQQRLYRNHRYFIWSWEMGGLAYNMTVLSLRRRLDALWAKHYV